MIPTGVVTFLFTDVVGSGRLWAADAAAMAASLEVHDHVLRAEIGTRGGYVFSTGGDAFCAAFDRATDAVAAAVAAQERLAVAEWPGPAVPVRMGIHLGEAIERDGDYFGPTLNATARLMSAGHGGQVLLTDAVRSAVDVDALDLGTHRLRDVAEPVRIWQVGGAAFPPLRAVGATTNLPVPATRLLGREDDVRAVRTLLDEHRLVTLVAVGGTGKTRLAIAVADQELPHWPDGVWFVDLSRVAAAAEVAAAVARALGLEVRGNPAGEIAAYVAARQLLVVLDNCEHVVDACAELVEAVLAAGGRSKVLATTREWLDVDGERVVHVHPLDAGPDGAAVRLFVDRAVAVEPSFCLEDGNAEAVVEVCRRLDGIPLAIELAASRVGVLTPGELAAGLDDRFRLLSGGRRRPRRRTLEATIDWSYDLLDPEEQRAFRLLGVFAGSFDLEAVAAVTEVDRADAVDLVEALYARSLVAAADDGPGRFRLLETLKAYAEDRLIDAGEAEAARERHCLHFADRCHVDDMTRAQSLDRMVRLLPDHANLVLAADWLEAGGRWEELGVHLGRMAFLTWVDASAMAARIRACADRARDPATLDWLRYGEQYLHMTLADWPAYVAAAGQLRRSADPSAVAHGYLALALITARQDVDGAHRLVDRYVDLAGDDPTGAVEEMATGWRCMVDGLAGELDGAVEWGRRILDGSGEVVGGTIWSNATQVLVVAAWAAGDASRAAELTSLVDRRLGAVAAIDAGIAMMLRFGRVLSLLAAGAGERAVAELRALAVDATTGRFALSESDALVLLAQLAREEGDDDRAHALLRSTSAPRSPASTAALRVLAGRLGVAAEIEAEYAAHLVDQRWMLDRPRRALAAEVARRGWLDR